LLISMILGWFLSTTVTFPISFATFNLKGGGEVMFF
jgi:hypothetical protein